MARILTLLLLVHLAVLVTALFDCLCAEEHAVRSLPRGTWVFVILLASPIGAIAWFVRGQPVPGGRVPGGPGRTRPARPAIIGPDDDPDFLRSLSARDPG